MNRSLMFAFAAILTLSLVCARSLAAQEESYAPQKVVYHVNFDGGDADKRYFSTLGNVLNHINAVGKNKLDLRVVMNGDGLGLLMEAKQNADLAQRIGNLKSLGVQFKVCRNTLTGRDIALDDLYDAWEEDIVPSGVAEVAKLQQDGFSYVKTY
ncbi:MAG: DsrE family protein [Chromatiales bacterium]|jgi:hypothetical protein